jgi:hypothetical protein
MAAKNQASEATRAVDMPTYTRTVELQPDEYTCRYCGRSVAIMRYPGSTMPTFCDDQACKNSDAARRKDDGYERLKRYRARKAGKSVETKRAGNPALTSAAQDDDSRG